MDHTPKQLRLILTQILHEVRWRILDDFGGLPEPLEASNVVIQDWVDRATLELDQIGAGPVPPSGTYVAGGPLEQLGAFLDGADRGLVRQLTAISTWWAAAERGFRLWPWRRSRDRRLDALSGALWHLEWTKAIAQAEVESAGNVPVWSWEAARELVAALGEAAKLF